MEERMTEDRKVRYRDLSIPLKVLTVLCWMMASVYLFYFFVGVIIGAVESVM